MIDTSHFIIIKNISFTYYFSQFHLYHYASLKYYIMIFMLTIPKKLSKNNKIMIKMKQIVRV